MKCKWKRWDHSAPTFPEEYCISKHSLKERLECSYYRCETCHYLTGMTGYKECPNPNHALTTYARKYQASLAQ